MPCARPLLDRELVQIVDVALANAARRAGKWLACRPGCSQCCVGAFVINPLDAARLRAGIIDLQQTDAARADRVQARARKCVSRLTKHFPGDHKSGVLNEDEAAQEQFLEFANEEVCPALDPTTGTCDLYQFRPMTCRVFGPPVGNEGGGLGICELCFHGATAEEIASCEMKPDPDDLEGSLLMELAQAGEMGSTIVAFVLSD